MTAAAGHPSPEDGADPGIRALLDEAIAACSEEPAAADRLREQRRRLDEPLRVALVGRVKAGKSTLLNALVGATIAPTDAGECTRVVTMYRYGAVPRVTLHDLSGRERSLPVRRAGGDLRLDLAGTPPEEVERLVVDWPFGGLAAATLIDTPGISSLSAANSARTHTFMGSEAGLAGADAVVFLTRQMQPDDVAFLSAFQAGTGSSGLQTTTITVLSRADEIGSGRIDALRAAEEVAQRMARDPAVSAVSTTVLPVAGLLGLAGRTLRHADFVALRTMASAPPGDLEAMLLTADRFCRQEAPVPVARTVRISLLERLGLFGIRLSVALLRAGVTDAQTLADELVRRSGLAELQRLIAVHFSRRGAQLKTATALSTVEAVLREVPLRENERLWRELERVRLSSHDLVELAVLARSRAPEGLLPPPLRAEGERLLGAEGPDPAVRLGLPPDATETQLRAAVLEAVARWRTAAADPLASRATLDAIDVVVHSCEALFAGLAEPAGRGELGSVAGTGQPRTG